MVRGSERSDANAKALACVVSLVLAIIMCALLLPAERHGDGIYYFATLKALARYQSPAISKEIQQEISDEFYPMSDELLIAAHGRNYDTHFFGYSLLSVPAFAILEASHSDPLKAFQLTNALIIGALLFYVLLRCRLGAFVRWGATSVFLFSTGILYFRWTHPEVLTAACLLASALAFLERRYIDATLLSAVASIQNPSAAAFIPIIAIAFARETYEREGCRLTRRSIRRLLCFGAATSIAVMPYLWSYATFGRLNAVVARGYVDYSLISIDRLFSLFFDLNQGAIVGVPFVVLAGVALVLLRVMFLRRGFAPRHEDWLIAVTLLIAIPVLAQRNWNAGSSVFMRYASWITMPLLVWVFAELGRQRFKARLIIMLPAACLQAALLIWVHAYPVDEATGYLTFKPWVQTIWTVAPGAYNPVPEVFYERATHREGYNGITFYSPGPGRYAKVLAPSNDPGIVAAELCGSAQLVNERPREPIVAIGPAQGFFYFNGRLRCAYPLPAHLSFTSENPVRNLEMQNWSTAESWGTWSDGTRATLRIPLNDSRSRNLRLDIAYMAYVNERAPKQTIRLTSRGRVLDSWTETSGQVRMRTIHVPADAVSDGEWLSLVFELPDAAVPAQLGLSDDRRHLALGLEAISISDAASAARALPLMAVSYIEGFFDPEKDDAGLTWRWMGGEGRVRLPSYRRDSTLRLRAGASVPGATLTVRFNGRLLEQFVAPTGNFERTYTVSAQQQAGVETSVLDLVVSRTVRNERDPRQLGLRVFDLEWSAARAPN